MTIRPLIEIAEFEKCVELQREAWGWADVDLLPVRFLIVQHHIGGLVIGAFEPAPRPGGEGERLIGFINATPGIRNGMSYWWSHMLAVAKDRRSSGVGSALKLAQREHALERGIRLIEWTYDPLESRNAYVNIVKLGAIVRRYYVNHYGETTASLQHGLESDRVIAEWWLEKPRIKIGGDIRRVFIPADIQALKQQSLKSAKDVQDRVREQFLKNFEEDYFVAGFERKDEWSEYLFILGASGVHQTN